MVRGDAARIFLGTRIVSYVGASRCLGRELERVRARSVVVVADDALIRTGDLDAVLSRVAGFPLEVGQGVLTADAATVEHIAGHARDRGCDAVLTVGGGTALSVGRAVALRLSNSGTIESYGGRDRAENAPAPCIAVPTTAGSGSEVSRSIVLHQPDGSPNVIVQGEGYEPRTAVLDGDLLMTLPSAPALYAALDALSHALEALWSANAVFLTDCLASAAASAIVAGLPAALKTPSPDAWQPLLEASALANLACGNTGIALVHALSSPALPLPHGLLNGILMPHVARFNYPFLSEQARAHVDQLTNLYDELHIPDRFRTGDLPPGAFERMRDTALIHPATRNNVRMPSASDIENVLQAAGLGPSTNGLER